jgi:hypothetical protein
MVEECENVKMGKCENEKMGNEKMKGTYLTICCRWNSKLTTAICVTSRLAGTCKQL